MGSHLDARTRERCRGSHPGLRPDRRRQGSHGPDPSVDHVHPESARCVGDRCTDIERRCLRRPRDARGLRHDHTRCSRVGPWLDQLRIHRTPGVTGITGVRTVDIGRGCPDGWLRSERRLVRCRPLCQLGIGRKPQLGRRVGPGRRWTGAHSADRHRSPGDRTSGHLASGHVTARHDTSAHRHGHDGRLRSSVTVTRTAAPVTVLGTVRAMACDVTVHGRSDPRRSSPDPVVTRALDVVRSVHDICTRFDPTSPLMQVNSRPGQWHEVPGVLFDAVGAAFLAYELTGGVFDPRVLGDLVDLGYDRSLPFADGVETPHRDRTGRDAPAPWRPRFRPGPRPELHLGGDPVDLGGIGKGLAVRWAAEVLRGELDDFLIDAGGDCDCDGTGPEADGWRVGVEDPTGGDLPICVLALSDRACATSSTRLRRWRSGTESVHHLIDPSTGRPGGDGLLAVTVVGTDAADAEITTKSLFLGGAAAIERDAEDRGIAALWVTTDGTVATSEAFAPYVIWSQK